MQFYEVIVCDLIQTYFLRILNLKDISDMVENFAYDGC